MKSIHALVPLFLAGSLSAQASTWSMSELPNEIQSCVQAETCFLFDYSNADFGNVSFFTLFAPNPTGYGYAMMLAGLGLMGMAARRKHS